MTLVYGGAGTRPCAVDPPLVLAPMAGITDMTYRLLLRRIGGVGLVTMEFISSEGLTRGNKRTERLLRFDPDERPISVQIYGADAERMADRRGARRGDAASTSATSTWAAPRTRSSRAAPARGLMRDLDKARGIIAACARRSRRRRSR